MSVSADSKGDSGEWRVMSGEPEKNNALGDTRVFCAKSAEVAERNGDGVFSRAKERGVGEAERGWVVEVTTKDRIYGE